MSMPEVQTPSKAAEPAATGPTVMATEPSTAGTASTDPIQSNGSNTLADSRPEVTDNTTGTGATAVKGPAAEAQPIYEGILNYKGPGLVKSLMFSKKFFWFSDEPLEHKHLSGYLSSEKADIAHRNAAHATQTGKGLLYYTKRAEDKGHPSAILNLGEITDLVKEGLDVLTFKIHGHKHALQAPSRAERDGWFAAIEAKSEEAKAAHEGLVGSEGYKSQLEKFGKPVGAAGAAATNSRSRSRPNKLTDSKPKEPVVTGAATTSTAVRDEPARTGSSSDEAKTNSKSKTRSQSGKRSSIFGTLRGKKEEHDEKKEIKKEEKAEEKVVKEEIKNEEKAEKHAEKEEVRSENEGKTDGTTTGKPLDAAGIAARVIGSPVEPVSGSEPMTTSTPITTNGEGAPTDAATTITEPAIASPTEPVTGTTARETAPKSTKRNSIFGNFFNKRDTTGPASPATETAPAVPAKDSETPLTSSKAPQIEDPASASGVETAIAPAPTSTEPSAAATDANATTAVPDSKPARRTSFFNTLGTKKERKPDASSDTEGTDGEGKKSSKFGTLFRKPSRAVPHSKTATTETSTPGTDALKASAEPSASTSKDVPAASNDTTIAPESAAISNSQTPVQATA